MVKYYFSFSFIALFRQDSFKESNLVFVCELSFFTTFANVKVMN